MARRYESMVNARPCAMSPSQPQKKRQLQNRLERTAPRTFAVRSETANTTDTPQIHTSNTGNISVADLLSGRSFLVDFGAEKSGFFVQQN